ncbi:MAG: Holliday junction branch migration protein RuvA [Magnetococcales bacterium]|nr:Holliday junction branch migration protein RuvA [Magnetococcales bacterium]NGZ26714.1 Holliday junction branch migration protein RuvA [Magnetococcales bacterium]
MIARLRGILAEKHPDWILVDVAGVGYRVFIPLSTYETLPLEGEAVQIVTVTVVREDAFHLYGFASKDERELFLSLNQVTGIGAKLALATLSAMSPATFADAINRADLTTLCRISGIGRRLAQRLAVELKDRLPNFGGVMPSSSQESVAPIPASATMREELFSALLNLGYKKPQVEQVLSRLGEVSNISEGLRTALRLLSPG